MKSKMKRMTVCVLTVAFFAILLGACSPDSSQSSAASASGQATKESSASVAASTATPIASPSAAASASEKVTDEDIQGTVEGRTYKNAAAGFELTYPEGYDINSIEDIEKMYADMIASLKEKYSDPEFKHIVQFHVPVSAASTQSKEIYSGMYITVADISSELPVDPVEYANSAVERVNKNSSTEKRENAVSANIGGIDCASVMGTEEVEGGTYLEKEYFIVHGNFLIILMFQGGDEDALNQIMKALDTVKMY